MSDKRFRSLQSYRELEADLREAIAAGDKDAVYTLRGQMHDFGMSVEELPPDLQAQMIDVDPLEHPELRHVLTPPDDYKEET